MLDETGRRSPEEGGGYLSYFTLRVIVRPHCGQWGSEARHEDLCDTTSNRKSKPACRLSVTKKAQSPSSRQRGLKHHCFVILFSSATAYFLGGTFCLSTGARHRKETDSGLGPDLTISSWLMGWGQVSKKVDGCMPVFSGYQRDKTERRTADEGAGKCTKLRVD